MKATVFLLCFVLFLGVVVGYCPNDCSSPNGVCSAAQVCQCEEGWAGDDCSVPDIQLRNGEVVEGEVLSRQWSYFHFLANSQQASVIFEVNQTSKGGDLDTYVRLDKYPTRQEYDMRDISTANDMKFEIPSPHGVYYVGIYGFLKGSYAIKVSMKTSCPNDCSGHGICNFDGSCSCWAGYGSDDCSQAVPQLKTGEQISDEVAQNEWRYYRLINTKNTINLTLSVEEDPIQDCDLYVKRGGLPSLADWDYRDATAVATSSLVISEAPEGDYYIGVVGYTESSVYTLLAETYFECPNKCSGENHGECSDEYVCICEEGYSGDACERKDYPLEMGITEQGHVGGNLWNYYHFSTATSTNVVVRMEEKNPGADCDLYIKRGAEPTKMDFDMRDISFSKEIVELVIENPSINAWYIGVYGYRECDYDISYRLSGSCPNDCSGNGECGMGGHCTCNPGWVTQDCSKESEALENGVVKSGTIANGQWQYFHLRALPGSLTTILVNEKNTEGVLWVYESAAGAPTQSSFDEKEIGGGRVHRVVIEAEREETVWVGVYGSYLAAEGVDYDFEVVAWQAVFD